MILLNEKLKYVSVRDIKTDHLWTWSSDTLRWSELPKNLLELIQKTMHNCIVEEVIYESDLIPTP